ncbi:transposase [Streptomyces mirabilis]|uniref:transposase n=1 Tax=Streptomyces mirabilis TaxID=68239 RepID=UPI00364E959F
MGHPGRNRRTGHPQAAPGPILSACLPRRPATVEARGLRHGPPPGQAGRCLPQPGPYSFVWVDAPTRKVWEGGLFGVQPVTSGAHTGLGDAIGAVVPDSPWQRCRTRYVATC